MSDLKIISLKNNLLIDVKKTEIINKVINRISELGLTDAKYKSDNEILVLICNIIEFLVTKKDKLNKKEICLEIFKRLFALGVTELESLSRNIDFIHANGNIKKVSYYKIFKCGVLEWVSRKFL